MKKIWKRLGCAVLAAAMLVGMGMTALADEDPGDEARDDLGTVDFTINGVEVGDTVNAYKLMHYVQGSDGRYNSMRAESNFKAFIADKDSEVKAETKLVEKYLESQTKQQLKELLGEYQNACATGTTYKLPSTYASKEITAENTSAQFQLEPGYYLFLMQTTYKNTKVYQPLSVFVKIDGNNLEVYTNNEKLAATEGSYAVTMKHENAPVIEKRVNATKSGQDKKWMTTAAAGVNDVATFYVKLTIPKYSNVKDLDLTLHDTLTNMKYEENSVTVYKKGPVEVDGIPSGGFDDEEKLSDAIGEVTASNYGNHQQTLIIPLNYQNITGGNGTDSSIWIVYKARVQADAVANNIHSSTNEAYLEYQNAMLGENAQKTASQTTTVYNYSLQLQKFKSNGTDSLSGAGFTFYEQTEDVTNRTPVKFVAVKNAEDENKVDYYRPYVEGADQEGDAITEIPADFLVKGLDGNSDSSSYYIKETTTPNGYYAPKQDFTLKLYSDYDKSSKEHTGILDSTKTKMTGDTGLVHAQEIDTSTPCQYNVKILNSTTPTLPTTGGKGTALFTVAGVALMAAAAYLFFFRRKKESK